MESAYEECHCFELSELNLPFERQVKLPVACKNVKLDCGYRMEIVGKDLVVVELKTVEHILPVHEAQLLSYLKLSGKRIGLLLNFHPSVLKHGIKRIRN